MLSTKVLDAKESYHLYFKFELDNAEHLRNEFDCLPDKVKASQTETLALACAPVSFEDFVLSYESMDDNEKTRMNSVWRQGFKEWNMQYQNLVAFIPSKPSGFSHFNPEFDYSRLLFPEAT